MKDMDDKKPDLIYVGEVDSKVTLDWDNQRKNYFFGNRNK